MTLTEFADFECPYSGSAVWIVKRLRRRFGTRLRFEFKVFPVTDLHPHAELAAEAAAIAEANGKFEEMHDLLFKNQEALDLESLAGYAEAVGLDRRTFSEELSSRKYWDRVLKDVEEGDALGVESTPTFFIDGVLYEGKARYPDLEAAIVAAFETKREAS